MANGKFYSFINIWSRLFEEIINKMKRKFHLYATLVYFIKILGLLM